MRHQLSPTARREAPDPMRKMRAISRFALIPATIVTGAVLLIAIATSPPQFIGKATFAIDWIQMPSIPNDATAEKVRNHWRKNINSELTRLPQSEHEISELLDRAPDTLLGNERDRTVISSNTRRWLRLTLLKQDENSDTFVIELRDNDPKRIESVVNLVLHGTVSRLNAEARTASGLAALRSKANVDNISDREDQLQRELKNLQENGSWDGSEAIRAELHELESKHTEAGLGLFINAGDALFASPVKILEAARVNRRRPTYGFAVLIAAILGGITGAAGLFTHRWLKAMKIPKTKTGRVGAEVPTNGVPPVIGQYPVAQSPPTLPAHSAPNPFTDQRITQARASSSVMICRGRVMRLLPNLKVY